MNKKTALIIGAGPAGLTTAYELLIKTDITPVIIEEADSVGGISKTFYYKNNGMDMGPHRFFSKSDAVINIWSKLMLSEKDDTYFNKNLDSKNIGNRLLILNRLSRIFFLKKFFNYPVTLSFDTMQNLGILKIIKIIFSYMFSFLLKRDEKTLEDFIINRFGKELYLIFFKDYTSKVWGVSPNEIPSDWGGQRIKKLSIFKVISEALFRQFGKKTYMTDKSQEISLIEKFYYPERGSGYFWESMAMKIEELGGKIIKNQKVMEIISKENKVISIGAQDLKNNIKIQYNGDYFFSSMPVKDLIDSFDEKDNKISEIAKGLKYRSLRIVGLLVSRLEISNNTKIKTYKNRIPDNWLYIQDPEVKLGRVTVFNNWSPYLINDYENTIWLGLEYFCNEDDEMWNIKDDDFIKFASIELEQIGIIKKQNILDGCVVKIPKAYPAYFGTYNMFEEIKRYSNQYENLFLIGRNGMHKYNNMDHSMLTAITAVNNIVQNIMTKDNIWAVNTEQDYNEIE